jgi:hypothetical protein
VRTACVSAGLQKSYRLFERFAAAVITLGELRLAVGRQSVSAGVYILDVLTISLIRK